MLFDLKANIAKIPSAYPFMNESMVVKDYLTTRPTATYDNLDYWIERTPEAIAIINAIVTDLRGDGIRFELWGTTERDTNITSGTFKLYGIK